MGCDPRECHASTRLTLSINVRLLYTRFCATAINTVTSQVRSMSVGLHTHTHAENITRDGKNAAFVQVYHLSSLQWSLENVTLCVRTYRKPLLTG